ncbi:MAG: metal-dependent transcriptional regulator [Oscillospiraceae bacterium]|nr:metal-dependent transcriptional regulator [Oscillospiraceae bacterium]
MAVHKSGEDYLEAILMIQNQKGVCRSIDVVHHLGVSKPSVSVAMSNLREDGMITTDEDGFLHFTDAGRALAESVYARHCLLTEFLTFIGVDEAVAKEDACKIEHDISPTSYQALLAFMEQQKS